MSKHVVDGVVFTAHLGQANAVFHEQHDPVVEVDRTERRLLRLESIFHGALSHNFIDHLIAQTTQKLLSVTV